MSPQFLKLKEALAKRTLNLASTSTIVSFENHIKIAFLSGNAHKSPKDDNEGGAKVK